MEIVVGSSSSVSLIPGCIPPLGRFDHSKSMALPWIFI
ncbi:hypothetical protein ACP4OV_014400 [Aristida adscensionis]